MDLHSPPLLPTHLCAHELPLLLFRAPLQRSVALLQRLASTLRLCCSCLQALPLCMLVLSLCRQCRLQLALLVCTDGLQLLLQSTVLHLQRLPCLLQLCCHLLRLLVCHLRLCLRRLHPPRSLLLRTAQLLCSVGTVVFQSVAQRCCC